MVFFNDLKDGKDFEDEMINKIKKENDVVVKCPLEVFSDYDFMINNIKYECKNDKMAFKTGNLCIEYKYKGHRSGIKTTKSDYYCIKISKDKIFIIPVKVIKDYIKDNKETIRKVYGGDNKNSKMYLIKYDQFINFLI
jgi:hypothetical protein